jgi:hypothetical protein
MLRNGERHATYANLEAVAAALGMGFELRCRCNEEDLAEQQALTKAEAIARMVQGTSALESQAVDDETYAQIVKQTVRELMIGPRRRLWSPI